MITTFANATLWLLAVLLAGAAWAFLRRASAAEAVAPALRLALSSAGLAVIAVASLGGLGSRIVIGSLAPGAYAEEVVAARAFLATRAVYGHDERAELAEWMRAEPPVATPWELPGLSTCQAGAFRDRPRFFSSQAHTPVLLLASVPIVRAVGGRGLYVCLLALSLIAVAGCWWLAIDALGLEPGSRASLLLAFLLVGWQPVLAGIRQGDAVLVAGGLVACTVVLARRGRWGWAGVAAGLAGVVSLPALGAVAALVRWPRALAAALVTVAVMALGAVAATGPMLLVDFARNVAETTRVYATMTTNYAVAGRVVRSSGSMVPILAALVAVFGITWMRARDVGTAVAAGATAGLIFAPIAWSQHLVLAFVPLAILLPRAARVPLACAAWALLALFLSLPDPVAAWLSAVSQPASRAPWPLVSVALLALWGWLVSQPAGAAR